ncbi:hypothetical protein NQZ68_042256 [Dissostichus eleginoides]|nr:hypothetical protein NQZ68_042256 [Dissostichus eleginoides]
MVDGLEKLEVRFGGHHVIRDNRCLMGGPRGEKRQKARARGREGVSPYSPVCNHLNGGYSQRGRSQKKAIQIPLVEGLA